jgi:hypothetical protein
LRQQSSKRLRIYPWHEKIICPITKLRQLFFCLRRVVSLLSIGGNGFGLGEGGGFSPKN